jgi:transcriptional regulator with XRE-family HTH domain
MEPRQPKVRPGRGGVIEQDGTTIRILRIQHHLRLAGAAEQIGCSPSYLGQIERGVRNASPELLQMIADFYEVTPSKIRKPVAAAA